MHPKPKSLHDRDVEWRDLADFVAAHGPRLRLGLMYGRRRYGKSYLLRRLTETFGGVYHLVLNEGQRAALDRFARSAASLHPGAPPGHFSDWGDALSQVVDTLGDRQDGPHVLVLDEYPYLRDTSAELDSVIQSLMDESSGGDLGADWRAPVSIIVCGSAMSVMTGILSGTSPMRGRASLDMSLGSFDYRQSRDYWGFADAAIALSVDAVVGGAAGYKDLTAGAGVPQNLDELGQWICDTLLNPSHALFREDEYLLREDPRVTSEAPYYSLLQAIAAGRSSQGQIAAATGRASSDIVHQLGVLTSAGFVLREDDLLTARRPAYRIADPIVRFHHLVTRRDRALLEDRRAAEVWNSSTRTFQSQVLGPHFETVCRRWVGRYASSATLGGAIGPVRRTQVNDRGRRQSFELDIAAMRRWPDGRTTPSEVGVLGEAKLSVLGTRDLDRLDRTAELLQRRDDVRVAPDAKRVLFSVAGFDPELRDAAQRRSEIELVDLERLYDGD
ncbi:AAA family ATPase [Candidatus Poriferisodalis sp.]|uniref:AAA family ATPase n=1 Tax=Candidatus Poriferisodalis sp. TaxID=3101277 RepID=UPI003B028133